jgi:hypothetical protein
VVADKDTRFITLFEQDSISKIITAKVQIHNDGLQELAINGIGIEITFNEKVAPYDVAAKKLFFGEITANSPIDIAEFAKYCEPVLDSFNLLGAQYMQRNNSGRMVAAKLSTATNTDTLRIAGGQVSDLIEFYFMPVNGEDLLDIDMFSYEYVYNTADYSRHTTWIGNATCYLQATGAHMPSVFDYVVSPTSFKLHMQMLCPAVSANNAARTVTGYNSATMEWANTLDGVYRSDVLPIIGNNAQTVFVRAKGDTAYSGNDELYGNYKMRIASPAVAVIFTDKTTPDPEWVDTDKTDAYGIKIPSNSHTYDAGSGVVFYWDQKQKDEGVLVIGSEFFMTNTSLTVVVNSSNVYRKMTITAPGSYDVRKWVDAKGKEHNINMIWIRFNN